MYVIGAIFQSTPPARGATQATEMASVSAILFQSTPPARGATPFRDPCVQLLLISIHAPREGGDAMEMVKAMVASISIHAPREGGDDLTAL